MLPYFDDPLWAGHSESAEQLDTLRLDLTWV